MKKIELTKAHWRKLKEFGLVDSDGNGFANTTKKCDAIGISSSRETLIQLERSSIVYAVRYYSGCFYPMWYRVQYGLTSEQHESINLVKKD